MTRHPEIQTPRLLLRGFRLTDVEDALAYRNDSEFSLYLPHIPFPFTQADAEAFVRRNIEQTWDEHPTFAVVYETNVIGTVNFEVDVVHRSAMLGYALGRAWWGAGLAYEAVEAASRWAATTFELDRVWASTDARNHRSIRLMNRLGMKQVATRKRDHQDRHGNWVDEVVYEMGVAK
ncbi:MAG: GNAT family N-acetyltransferase [Myxococcota bacterium]